MCVDSVQSTQTRGPLITPTGGRHWGDDLLVGLQHLLFFSWTTRNGVIIFSVFFYLFLKRPQHPVGSSAANGEGSPRLLRLYPAGSIDLLGFSLYRPFGCFSTWIRLTGDPTPGRQNSRIWKLIAEKRLIRYSWNQKVFYRKFKELSIDVQVDDICIKISWVIGR